MFQLLVSMMVAALGGDAERTHVRDDVYHHELTVRLGDTPNARIRLHRVVRERAPWIARPTHAGVMLLHGDFSTFESNFGGLAPWLAERGVDVWGFDRRWAFAPADADLSDFGDMSFAQEIDDTGRALAAARTLRAFTGSGSDRMHLIGFSRGGFLAYAAAAADGARPAPLRQVKGLVPLDVWAEIPPDDTAAREWACFSAELERNDLAAGFVDSPNDFFIILGGLVQTAPDEPSPFPFFDGLTNRQSMLSVAARTYLNFTPTPHYHLAAAELDETGFPLGLTESPESAIAQWFASAAPHQSLREAADTDGMWCGDGQGPFAVDLSRIRVPVHYVGAAGGFGTSGLYSLTRVASSDVSSNIVQRLGPEGAFEDFGHGDLLFADDAPALAWQPLANWLASH